MVAAKTCRYTRDSLQPMIALNVHDERRESRPQTIEDPAVLAQSQRSPRAAELVEREETGRFYLRAYTNGRYLWQPVTCAAAAIPDTGTWLGSNVYRNSYWYNHGAYRRRAGWYHAVAGSSSVTHAAAEPHPSASRRSHGLTTTERSGRCNTRHHKRLELIRSMRELSCECSD
jgi:hypothetical protein